jgi:hypothetical protein
MYDEYKRKTPDEVLGKMDKIQLYPITVTSEADLAIAFRCSGLSLLTGPISAAFIGHS